MKIFVRIKSHLSEDPGSVGIGECFFDEGTRKITWIQPAGEGEVFGAKYSLHYDDETHVLEVERVSSHISRMAFCQGVRTRGELQTPEGSFETQIFTHRMTIPENGIGDTELHYDLIPGDGEPIRNTLVISVFEDKRR